MRGRDAIAAVAGLACGAAALAGGSGSGGVVPFTSEHAARGVTYNMILSPPITNPMDGYGMALADLEGDGDLDLVLLGRADGLVGVYENGGAGTFTNRSATSGIAATPAGCGVAAFDYDLDGDLDLYVTQRNAPCRLWRNDGALHFTDVTAAAGVALTTIGAGCSVADYDGDGWPDLYVCAYSAVTPNRLYRNQGNGTFVDVARALDVASTGLSYQSVWSDVDRDGWPDLCVSNDRGFGNVPNQLWRNLGGTFQDIGASSGLSVSLCSMGIACGDVDGNGLPDFYFTNVPDNAPPLFGVNPLMLSAAPGSFVQADAAWGVSHRKMSWGAVFWDFDNDGDQDLYVNNETLPNTLYRNAGAPPMADIAGTAAIAGTTGLSYVSVVGDIDGDGDLDMVQNNLASAVRIYVNHEGERRNWLRLRVAGGGRTRDAVGASAGVVAVDAAGGTRPAQWREVLCGGNGYLGQNETTLHFGLDDAVGAATIEVRWPGGGPVRTLRNVPANQSWTAYPPSRLGDVDGDGVVNASDWAVCSGWGPGAVVPGREMLDFDGDWDIDSSDAHAFWARASCRRGDFNLDGSVDGADLATLLASWGLPGPADLNLDGRVDGADLGRLLQDWSVP